tara:strand:- start:451 stop:825 length:375 start_codon:yes stop_codon:yes gene_type:complete
MPELNRRLMGLFQTAEAEATTVRGALDAAQIANTSGRLVSTAVKLANNRREKVDGEWLDFMDPEKVQKQHKQVEAEQKKEKAEPKEVSPKVEAAIEKSKKARLLEQAAKAEDKARRLREEADEE